MIFVTVGTHEQQFDRLLKEIDRLAETGIIRDEVLMQSGYCTCEIRHCETRQWIPYDEMIRLVQQSDIVITHGGPSSFMLPLSMGKIPIVVPRRKQYNEHVNDHQFDFCHEVENQYGNIIVVDEVENLQDVILNYSRVADTKKNNLNSNNMQFNKRFREILIEMMN